MDEDKKEHSYDTSGIAALNQENDVQFAFTTKKDSGDCRVDSIVVYGTPVTIAPTSHSTPYITTLPTDSPTMKPTNNPSIFPTNSPMPHPTNIQTLTEIPTFYPTHHPTLFPTLFTTKSPFKSPTMKPTNTPSIFPTNSSFSNQTEIPTLYPTNHPATNVTEPPTANIHPIISNHQQKPFMLSIHLSTLMIIIGSILCFCITIILYILSYYRYKLKQQSISKQYDAVRLGRNTVSINFKGNHVHVPSKSFKDDNPVILQVIQTDGDIIINNNSLPKQPSLNHRNTNDFIENDNEMSDSETHKIVSNEGNITNDDNLS